MSKIFLLLFVKILSVLCITMCLLSAVGLAYAEPYTFAVLNFREGDAALKQWGALSDYLSQKIDAPIQLVSIKPAGMVARAAKFDFILTNPVSSIVIAEQEIHDIVATLDHKTQGSQFAGVIIVRKDSPVTELEQLAGKRVGVVDLNSAAGGFLLQAYELIKVGLIPERDFANFVVIPDQKAITYSVVNKSIDAGFIRTGMLEALQKTDLDTSQVRILNEQSGTIAFPRSTDLYPNWGFLISKNVPADIRDSIQKALLGLTPDDSACQPAGINGFVGAVDYHKVRDIMRALHVPPFDS